MTNKKIEVQGCTCTDPEKSPFSFKLIIVMIAWNCPVNLKRVKFKKVIV